MTVKPPVRMGLSTDGRVAFQLMEKRRLVSHADAEQMLRRAGYSQEQIKALLRDLPDPIDSTRDRDTVFKHGISLGALMDRMGGSP